MNTDILAVNEWFGPTFQGEGRNAGMPCAFLRLAGCNLACSWCDTKYAWDWQHYDVKQELHPMTVEAVVKVLQSIGLKSLVVTGGEPMLQQHALRTLTHRLMGWGWWVEIETAGTVAPLWRDLADQYTVSLKLANSGNPERKRLHVQAIEALRDTRRAVWKFVVETADDLAEIDTLVQTHHLHPVYIMPEGTDPATLMHRAQLLADSILARGYHLSPRLHVELWGKRRGI